MTSPHETADDVRRRCEWKLRKLMSAGHDVVLLIADRDAPILEHLGNEKGAVSGQMPPQPFVMAIVMREGLLVVFENHAPALVPPLKANPNAGTYHYILARQNGQINYENPAWAIG